MPPLPASIRIIENQMIPEEILKAPYEQSTGKGDHSDIAVPIIEDGVPLI